MNPTAELVLLILELRAADAETRARLTPRQHELLAQLERDAARN
jgi:hypothetical protein